MSTNPAEPAIGTTFSPTMQEQGWRHFPQVVESAFVAVLRDALYAAELACREIRASNGIPGGNDGTAHHILGLNPCFLAFLERQYLQSEITAFFDGPYVLNSFGGVIHRQDQRSYVCNVHRDIRSFVPNLPLMLNMLVMLDDFTLENGATYLLSGSQTRAERPDNTSFFDRADQAMGKAGDIVLFNSGIWHAAGENRTAHDRCGLTLTFTVPYLKPQLDYVRLLGTDAVSEMPEHLQQVLGYYARVPSSLDEWYQPLEKRFYRTSQG